MSQNRARTHVLIADITLVDLMRLHLVMVQIPGDAKFRFPLLETLVLDRVRLSGSGRFIYQLPRLRHLADGGAYKDPGQQQRLAFLSEIAPQLVSFSTLINYRHELPRAILDSTTLSLLVAGHVTNPSWIGRLLQNQASITLLRLTIDSDFGASDQSARRRHEALADWVDALVKLDKPLRLRTLYLPDHLKVLRWRLQCRGAQSEAVRLLRFCMENGVEIVWELGTSHCSFSSDQFIHRSAIERRQKLSGGSRA